jgi:hypothetical protein
MGATRQECAEPHREFTGTDDFIARATSAVTHMDTIEAVSTPNQLVLAWRY